MIWKITNALKRQLERAEELPTLRVRRGSVGAHIANWPRDDMRVTVPLAVPHGIRAVQGRRSPGLHGKLLYPALLVAQGIARRRYLRALAARATR